MRAATKYSLLVFLSSLLLVACKTNSQDLAYRSPPGDCEWCGAADAPTVSQLSWQAVIPTEEEIGEKLIISGTIFQPDGKTPAPGIMVYVYHTNSKGVYPKKGDEQDNARRHGYLRAWMITDEEGRYKFETIKPEPYPNRAEPAHIHYTLTGKSFEEYWLEATLFEGDELITEEDRKITDRSGGKDKIIPLRRDNGILYGKRDLVLNKTFTQ